MCGIVGIVSQNHPIEKALLDTMADVMIHRGPDDKGFYLNTNRTVGLGFRRLSIIDLNTGNQPLANETGDIQMVFNGEIYNFQELRDDLQKSGHQFKTKGDSECIVHGYEEYGEKIFTLLNGMFAIAIWDGRKSELLLARDRCGEKPLHYFHRNVWLCHRRQ